MLRNPSSVSPLRSSGTSTMRDNPPTQRKSTIGEMIEAGRVRGPRIKTHLACSEHLLFPTASPRRRIREWAVRVPPAAHPLECDDLVESQTAFVDQHNFGSHPVGGRRSHMNVMAGTANAAVAGVRTVQLAVATLLPPP